ncbi:MAG TPA: MFS transporter [Acetobacteraceae bacterium]|nr:MFS transporter [Acetobacteraceae bacterium]
MTRLELRFTAALAAVFAARLLGLFMIYPVFAGYASHLRGATPAMIGIALGAYGLTQGLLQIPYGLVSDRTGRRPVIAVGLLLFAAGSIVAALAHSIGGLTIGRTLQGTGAVGSVVLATVADLTREEVRTRAMAIVGMTIGMSFAVAIVLGPVFAGLFGVPGIFWLTALLAVLGIAIIYGVVPGQAQVRRHLDTETIPRLLGGVISDGQLLRLDISIFVLHVMLTASFLAVPLVLLHALNIPESRDWIVYLPVLAVSIVLMVPAILVAEKGGRMKEVFLATILLLAASQLVLLLWSSDPIVVALALVGFFTGFNIMEASLPSLITKIAPANAKGTATGVYSSAQFLGIFVGGVGGGLASAMGGTTDVFALTLIAALIWFGIAATMRRPSHYSSYLTRIGGTGSASIADLISRLKSAPGVVDAVIAADEGVAYLKIDKTHFNPDEIARIVGA